MSDRRVIGRAILYFGKPLILACDARCFKAWGINSRPRVQINVADEDDYALLADGELGAAPLDPGTYEGECAKPTMPHMTGDLMNKWCARECERSRMVENLDDLALPDFSERVYNIKRASAVAGPTGGDR